MNRADLRSNIIPGMRYKDAFTAIDWLCDVLGFTRHLVVPDGKGGVAHAELTLGNGMIMLGSRRDDAGDSVVPPAATELWTQSAYIVAGDIEASYERAKAAQADIVTELEEQPLRRPPVVRPRSRGTALEYRFPRPMGGPGERLNCYLRHAGNNATRFCT